MKKTWIVVPLMCSLSVLQGCEVMGQHADSTMKVEPHWHVKHSDPTPAGLYRLGRYHQQQYRLEQAAQAYLKSLEGDAAYVEARNALATVYSTQGKHEKAIAEFDNILKTSPQLAHVYNNLGYAYYRAKNYPMALAAYEKAIDLDPQNLRAIGNLALVRQTMGDTEKVRVAAGPTPASTASGSGNAGTAAQKHAVAQKPALAANPVVKVAGDSVSPQTRTFRLSIANGTRDAGLAKNLMATLNQNGFPVDRVGKLKPYTQRRTVILYRDGFRDEAVRISSQFITQPVLVKNKRPRSTSDNADVRLVVGRTAISAAALAPVKQSTHVASHIPVPQAQ